jgi:hypothetical protein
MYKVPSFAFVAQWIEHPPPKGRVAGSILAEGTIQKYLTKRLVKVKILPQSFSDLPLFYFA